MSKSKSEIKKVKLPEDYPAELGSYLRGNNYSPVAVAVLLNASYSSLPSTIGDVPDEAEKLVRVAVESGAALAGTLQTENIGIEKIIANIASNPNIRYLIICGKEVGGHCAGDALKALIKNGVNEKRTIIGAIAPTPYLFNLPPDAIQVFRNQITLVDLIDEVDPTTVSKAVWSCYQEKPTAFRDYHLYDPGAYSEKAKSYSITMKVEHPEEIERWELEEVVEKLESEGKMEEKRIEEKVEKKSTVEEKVTSKSADEKFVAIGRQLAKIAEELSGIAKILVEESEVVEEGEKAVLEIPSRPCALPKEETSSEKEKVEIIFFENHLRAYNGIFAGFTALKNDMCGGGLSLPTAVNSAFKKLTDLREQLDKSTISDLKKREIALKIDGFLKQTEELPTEPGPCQKTVGNCKIGKGCFATSLLTVLKLIKEPSSP